MHSSQSNTRKGPIPVAANADLTGKEAHLAKVVNNSGVLNAALPSASGDDTPFLITDGGATGATVTLQPLVPGENVRLKLNGTCDPGDKIVREDETGADTGKVRKLPVAAGTYSIVGIAEDKGVDEGLALVRPYRLGETVTVV